ncbi:hypothetical protein AAFF_G00089260 [Aldrovandia affinis]|uniref:Uncharacterized protein n=1 Tax=Aldrovandia affinis TaxID=143900 RepID=A0AAD7WBY2_9TELE|nr:hypothetical protein AAFF_G00089260 [Aldrovandia affinis]
MFPLPQRVECLLITALPGSHDRVLARQSSNNEKVTNTRRGKGIQAQGKRGRKSKRSEDGEVLASEKIRFDMQPLAHVFTDASPAAFLRRSLSQPHVTNIKS